MERREMAYIKHTGSGGVTRWSSHYTPPPPLVPVVLPAGGSEQDSPALLRPRPPLLRQCQPGLPGPRPGLRPQLQVSRLSSVLLSPDKPLLRIGAPKPNVGVIELLVKKCLY